MILEYVSQVGPERVLDTLEVDDDGMVVSTENGKGVETCEMLQRRYGTAGAARAMAGWSNGYVGLREVASADVAE